MRVAEILSQGDEVVTGQIADTNAAWLSERLTHLGFHVRRHQAVGDHHLDLVHALANLADRCDLVMCTGGLGPTDDDLTAAAVGAALGVPLERDAQAMAAIEARYAALGRVMPEVNRKQADLPRGSLRLDNDWGTAPGFLVRLGRAVLICLPGVPREMKALFEHRVLPILSQRWALQPGRLVTLRTTGVGESDLQQRMLGFDGGPATVGWRTILPENHVKLRFPPEVSPEVVSDRVADLAHRLGRPLFTIEGLLPGEVGPAGVDTLGGDLASVVGRQLAQRGQTVSVAESCTGGQLAAAFTSVPGASGWFWEGVVSYSNEAKQRRLGVPPDLLQAHGAVSAEVAQAMAAGARRAAGTDWALSTTGIAGPDGGTPTKPVGTVFLGLAGPEGVSARSLRLAGDRARIQALTVAAALDTLRRALSA